MEKLSLNFKISNEEINRMRTPFENIQSELIKKCIEFRERVFFEITKEKNRDPKLITFVRHIDWEINYSQVFYDGEFQGHLYEDFINCNFRFEPGKSITNTKKNEKTR